MTCLTYNVVQIDVEDFPDIKSGYKITFTFKQNPFFKNQALVKELHYADDNALAIKGTDIEWTETGVHSLHFFASCCCHFGVCFVCSQYSAVDTAVPVACKGAYVIY